MVSNEKEVTYVFYEFTLMRPCYVTGYKQMIYAFLRCITT